MEDDLTILMKKKNDILKRIEENKRLMELIRNPYIKDTLGPLQVMKKNIAVKKIQKYWRERKERKLKTLQQMQSNLGKAPNTKTNYYKKYSTKSSINGNKINSQQQSDNVFEINYKIVLIQRAFRTYLSNKTKNYLTSHYVNEFNREFFAPLKYDRVSILKNEMINKIKSKEMPNRNTDFQEILNTYYAGYKVFNEDFPDLVKLKSDNLSKYYQCMSLVNHMVTQTELNKMQKFNDFYLNRPKEQSTKKLNEILESIEQKMWWYRYRDMDDFEENNIVNEMDSHFGFEKISNIYNKK
jgi:hypothetical protein